MCNSKAHNTYAGLANLHLELSPRMDDIWHLYLYEKSTGKRLNRWNIASDGPVSIWIEGDNLKKGGEIPDSFDFPPPYLSWPRIDHFFWFDLNVGEGIGIGDIRDIGRIRMLKTNLRQCYLELYFDPEEHHLRLRAHSFSGSTNNCLVITENPE